MWYFCMALHKKWQGQVQGDIGQVVEWRAACDVFKKRESTLAKFVYFASSLNTVTEGENRPIPHDYTNWSEALNL